MTPTELRRKGFLALVDALCYVDAIRFLQQYDPGQGDYTKERQQWLEQLNLDDFRAYVKRKRKQETSQTRSCPELALLVSGLPRAGEFEGKW